jgi:hypothetical protein
MSDSWHRRNPFDSGSFCCNFGLFLFRARGVRDSMCPLPAPVCPDRQCHARAAAAGTQFWKLQLYDCDDSTTSAEVESNETVFRLYIHSDQIVDLNQ